LRSRRAEKSRVESRESNAGRWRFSIFEFRFSNFVFRFSVLLLLAASPAWAGWTLKNHQAGYLSGGNPLSLSAFSGPLTNPSLIVVVLRVESYKPPLGTVPTDTAGNAYQDCGPGRVNVQNSNYPTQVFYAQNTSTTASNVVSIANPNGGGFTLDASEWTGGTAGVAVDVYASTSSGNSGTGGGQNMTSGSATTAVPGELIFGQGATQSGHIGYTPYGTGTGFTLLATPDFINESEYLVQGSAGPIAATWADPTNNDLYGAIMVAFRPADAAYSAAVAESQTASDALARSGIFSRGDAETNTVSDAIARWGIFSRGDPETNTVSDAIARAGVFGRGPSESNTASDVLARSGAFGRSDSEGQTASDALARAAALGRSDSESQTASDAVVRVAGFGRGDTENDTASDVIARVAGFGRGPSESNGASDAIARVADFGRGASENNVASDAIARLAGFGRGPGESSSGSDAIARLAGFGRGDTENNIASDAIARVADFGRGASENNPSSDGIARSGIFGRGPSENNSASDAIARVAGLGRGPSESNTGSDAIARLAGLGRGESESNPSVDALSRGFVGLRLATEGSTSSDQVLGGVNFGRPLPRHELVVPGQVKAGPAPAREKTGTAPVH
jgi:hypothetical protein